MKQIIKFNIAGLRIPTGRRQTSWLFTSVVEDLNSGPLRTNPARGQGRTLNSGPPDYKSSAQTTRPHCLLTAEDSFKIYLFLSVNYPGSARGGSDIPVYPKKIRQNTPKYPKFIQIYPKLYPGILYT